MIPLIIYTINCAAAVFNITIYTQNLNASAAFASIAVMAWILVRYGRND